MEGEWEKSLEGIGQNSRANAPLEDVGEILLITVLQGLQVAPRDHQV